MGKSIVLTGGGTAGHVTPNIALIDILKSEGWDISYIGSKESVEKEMITAIHIPYYPISSGKLRRYFSWKNFIDPLWIFWGICQSFYLLKKLKAKIVFSKGGFVAFPVVVAAWLWRIPVIAHESDLSPGLANRLSFPFVNKICVTFAPAVNYFKQKQKVEVTGTPIRKQLFQGDQQKGLGLCGFNQEKSCLLVIGGSQGAQALNTCVRQALPSLTKGFQIIHLCGKGKIDSNYLNYPNYFQKEYANEELADLFAASDLVISRAGANSLYEILALGKPHILIPLSKKVSRGDQIQNARYFQQQGISTIIMEEELTTESLLNAVDEVQKSKHQIIDKINGLNIKSAGERIAAMLKEQVC